MRQLHVSFLDVISVENLLAAWEEFVAGKRDRADVQEFARALLHHCLALHADLRNGTYRHGGYKTFRISDPKPRIINKATVRDRLLHRAIYRQLYPAFDRSFIHESYSCRNDKGTHRAVDRLTQFVWQVSRSATQPCWVLKLDIRKFFDSIDHTVLLDLLAVRVADPQLVGLLHQVIGSFSTTAGKGLPLGNLTSQLFANVYLDPLDKFAKHRFRVRQYVRYADDFVLVGQDKRLLIRSLVEIQEFLSLRLKLNIHPDKIELRKLRQGIDFLGYVVLPHHRVPRTRTKRRLFLRANETNEASYRGLLSHANAFELSERLSYFVEMNSLRQIG